MTVYVLIEVYTDGEGFNLVGVFKTLDLAQSFVQHRHPNEFGAWIERRGHGRAWVAKARSTRYWEMTISEMTVSECEVQSCNPAVKQRDGRKCPGCGVQNPDYRLDERERPRCAACGEELAL